MDENMTNRIDVSDVKPDANGKHILNSPNKIIRWIKHQFEEQEIDYRNHDINDTSPLELFINLSDCIINTFPLDGNPSMTNLCDILNENDKVKLLDCFINNGSGNRFHQEVLERVECTNSLIYSAFFHQTKFHKDVNFEGTEFKRYASFGGCLFEKHTYFQKASFAGNFDFDRCTFNDNVYFKEAKFNIDQIHFGNSIFKGEFNAQKIEFLNDDKRHNISNANEPYIDFYRAEFHQELNLSQIDFTRDCYFTDAKFYSSVNFVKSHFKTAVTFNNAEINGNVLFTAHSDEKDHSEIVENTIKNISFHGSTISGRLDFENCKIGELKGCFANVKNGAILRIYESRIKSINLTSIYNNGVIMLEDNHDNIEEITLKSAINSGVIEIENTEVRKITDRKTARILKDAALKSGNNIDALEYRKKEMELFKEDKNNNKSSDSKFLLWLNGISNNHGTNWCRGLQFTVICWIGSYLLFLITSRIEDIYALLNGQPITWTYSQDISNGISYLWSLNFLGTLSEWIEKVVFSSVWWLIILKLLQLLVVITLYIIGKIAIGYGIFQTISAFRKYGK